MEVIRRGTQWEWTGTHREQLGTVFREQKRGNFSGTLAELCDAKFEASPRKWTTLHTDTLIVNQRLDADFSRDFV
jgi:hypothetical protein